MMNLDNWDLASLLLLQKPQPYSHHICPIYSNATFFSECLISYQVVHGKQYSLPIIGPPISGKVPMLSLLKPSSYAQCLLVIYSHSNFH